MNPQIEGDTNRIKSEVELQEIWMPFVYKFGNTTVWINSLKDFVEKTEILKKKLDYDSLKKKINSTGICLISSIFVCDKQKYHILNFIFVVKKLGYYFPETIMKQIIGYDKQNWWLSPINNAKCFVKEHGILNHDFDGKKRVFGSLDELIDEYLYLYEYRVWENKRYWANIEWIY